MEVDKETTPVKFVLSLLLLQMIASSWTVHAQVLSLNNQIKDGSSVKFKTFSKSSQFGSWLQMNLPFDPMNDLLNQVESLEGVRLKSRGEAHITVVTPVEYWDILKEKISMEEINEVARNFQIQNSNFQIECLGRGEAKIKNKLERTYYVVVSSSDLVDLRSQINEMFISRGGNSSAFNPSDFFPHITLGFTKRDLHESDGILKDSASCLYPIVLK